MKLLIAIIVFSFSYADLKIKTKNDELILKSGHSIFYVNKSKKKHMYNYFESNLINGNISIDSIKTITKVETLGFEFFSISMVLGLFGTLQSEGTFFIDKETMMKLNLIASLGFSIVAGGIGYLIKIETEHKILNEKCYDLTCTKWIKTNESIQTNNSIE